MGGIGGGGKEDDVGLVSTLANDDSTSTSDRPSSSSLPPFLSRGRARNARVSPVHPPYKGCSNSLLQEARTYIVCLGKEIEGNEGREGEPSPSLRLAKVFRRFSATGFQNLCPEARVARPLVNRPIYNKVIIWTSMRDRSVYVARVNYAGNVVISNGQLAVGRR